MYLPHKADHYKPTSSMTTGTLQPKSAVPALQRKDVRCNIQPAGFKDRTTWLGHIAEEPWTIYLRYRPDHTFEQGDELRRTENGTVIKYQVLAVMPLQKDHLKCICKRVKT